MNQNVKAPSARVESGIRGKLLTTMGGLIVAIVITLTIIHARGQKELMNHELARRLELNRAIILERGRTLSEDLRRQAAEDIASLNFSHLSDLMRESVQGNPELKYVIVMDAGAKAYVHTLNPGIEQERLAGAADQYAAGMTVSTNMEYVGPAGGVIEFIEMIHVGNERWGVLRLGYSTESLNNEIARARADMTRQTGAMVRRHAEITVVFLVIGFFVVLWQSVRLTNPIVRLTDSALRLAGGDFSAAVKVDAGSKDEVGALSKAFATMSENLKQSYTRLESVVEETRRTEAFLDSIVENLPNTIFVKDARDLRYVRFNRAGEELVGHSREDLIGKNDYDFFGKEMADFFTEKDREVLRSGKLMDIPEEPISTQHKGMRYLHTKKIPIFDRDGKPQYLLGISEDITALKQAQDERRLFFTHSLDLLCIADMDGHFLQVNPAFENTLGYSTEEFLRRPFIEFVHPDDVEATQAVSACLARGEDIVSFENRYTCKDGGLRWLLWNATADLSTRRIYAVARDMTERHELEKRIVQISTQEQERIARDLHDGLGQILTGLALKSKMMMHALTDAGAPADRAREIVLLANQASEQARALARGLDPVMLQEGLPAALQDLSQTTREIFGVPCNFESDHFDASMDKFESTHLYRIAQEAVNNGVRHGKPHAIRMVLKSLNGQVSLTVSDDGKGLSGMAGNALGMGLRNMKYRARMIGASLSILSNEKGGTTVLCTMRRRAPSARRDEK